METSKDSEWNFNHAPGHATGSMAPPGVVLCCACGREIKVDEDCFDRELHDNEGAYVILYICGSCFKERLG